MNTLPSDPLTESEPLAESKPLTDEAVRRFITDGYLILHPDVPADIHARIDDRLLYTLHKEGNPGNNILPIVPELYAVIESPEVRGALTAILGPNYVLHPHRYAHNNEPGAMTAEGAQVGAGSHTFVGWHQDSHSPLARPRHHYFRYAMLLYYPQDTPIERGPTQIIPGTQWNRDIPEAEKVHGFQAAGPAGTCVLVHFDIVHGGSLNLSDRTRTMVKLVFARTEAPIAPTWDCQETEWRTPAQHHSMYAREAVWQHHWNWLSGRHNAPTSSPSNSTFDSSLDSSFDSSSDSFSHRAHTLLANLQEAEPLRQEAIYTLAAMGAPAVQPLIERLAGATDNPWEESAIVMEDAAYALAAIGQPALPALVGLLDHPSEWVRINAIFALGEMDARAAEAVPALSAQLKSHSHAIVRTTLDALGQIRVGCAAALPDICRLLTTSNPEWQTRLRRHWTVENQVRINAVMALLRLGETVDVNAVLPALTAALDDECGYVGGFGTEYLLRCNDSGATAVALRYLYRHRWDNTLHQGIRTY